MIKNKKILIIGASRHSKVLIDCFLSSGGKKEDIYGYLDDNPSLLNKTVNGFKVLGKIEDIEKFKDKINCVLYAIASIKFIKKKEEIITKIKNLGFKFCTVIHPTAVISNQAVLNEGVFIGPRVIIQPGTVINNHVIIYSGSIIEHDNKIDDYSFIAPGVVTSGNVSIGKGVFVGTGSCIKNNIQIGDYSIIGIGSNVVEDVEKNKVVFGNPARVIKNAE